MFALIAKGGIIMIPILLCSIVSLAVIMERLFFWAKHARGRGAEALLGTAEQSGLEEMCRQAAACGGAAARVLASGASHRGSCASSAMEAQAMEEAAAMKKYLPVMDTVITLAPLLGLLGTIVGMIQAFDVISLTGLGQPHAVTGGVAEALIATASGLIVAILTLIPYNYFQAKAEKATAEMERYATRIEVMLADRPRQEAQ